MKKRSEIDATDIVRHHKSIVRVQKMSLVITEGKNDPQRVPVDRDLFTIGKDPACDLVLQDRTVSRRHLEIEKQGETYFVRDLKSTNGTMIDGTRIKEAFLSPGAIISAGNVEIIFQPYYEALKSGQDQCESFGQLVAASSSMKSIMSLMRVASNSGATVLLQGETGVGKSALARAMHEEGARKAAPFVVFDCSSVPPTLIESELFGAERGAYTGATRSRPGACEQAQGGTLFLDEIEDLPLDLQSKLLRVLEEREIRRLGSTRSVTLDIQIITACKIDLARAVKEGRFRSDLYYRIAVICVEIPALRDRSEDIPLLCDHFFKEMQGDYSWARLTPALQEPLLAYSWPGNLRELRNVLERIQCTGPSSFLKMNLDGDDKVEGSSFSYDLNRPFKEIKEELIIAFEREYLQRLLDRSKGRIAPAAREAGLNRKYFYDLLNKHGLHGRNQ